MDMWHDDEYLASRMGDAHVRVNWTPDGRADSIRYIDGEAHFVEPVETRMEFGEALRCLGETVHRQPTCRIESMPCTVPDAWVPYISAQNDSMHSDFAPLVRDLDGGGGVIWDSLFGSAPEAVNFWAGDARSLTSFHKDHYENIYFVLRGCKHVRLLPPTEGWRLRFVQGINARHVLDDDGDGDDGRSPRIDVDESQQRTRWSAVGAVSPADGSILDVLDDEACGAPLDVRVSAGSALYIPSMWFHEVCAGDVGDHTKDDMSIAVNRWYDMVYGERYAILHALEQM